MKTIIQSNRYYERYQQKRRTTIMYYVNCKAAKALGTAGEKANTAYLGHKHVSGSKYPRVFLQIRILM